MLVVSAVSPLNTQRVCLRGLFSLAHYQLSFFPDFSDGDELALYFHGELNNE
jgi:hypothetical protein